MSEHKVGDNKYKVGDEFVAKVVITQVSAVHGQADYQWMAVVGDYEFDAEWVSEEEVAEHTDPNYAARKKAQLISGLEARLKALKEGDE